MKQGTANLAEDYCFIHKALRPVSKARRQIAAVPPSNSRPVWGFKGWQPRTFLPKLSKFGGPYLPHHWSDWPKILDLVLWVPKQHVYQVSFKSETVGFKFSVILGDLTRNDPKHPCIDPIYFEIKKSLRKSTTHETCLPETCQAVVEK